MYDLSGRSLGKYVVDRPIGRGGMAVVYLGHDPGLNRPVAIKVMDPAMTAEPGAVERFRREAITAANLEHPHIMPVYDVREDNGLWYLAMRYVPGRALREIITQEGPLPLERTVRILRPVAAALDHAHRHGVTHRDVKPGNILVEPDDNVVLTDFGIARSGSEARLTQAGLLMGTAEYLAPEQIRGEEATPASDLYSLGIVLYEMLTGALPFTGDNPAEVLYRQVHEPAPPLRAHRPDLPAALQPVIDHALNKNPAARYPTGQALADAVAAAATGVPARRVAAGPAAAGGPPTAWEPASRPIVPAGPGIGRRQLLAVAAVVLLLLGLAAIAIGIWRSRTPGPVAGPAFAPPAPVTYSGPLRQNNGVDLHANAAREAPAIDGRLDDWTGASVWPAPYVIAGSGLTPPRGPADLSASFRAGYNSANFYLGAVITDDVHVQNAQTRGNALWKGDDIELWFDTDLPGDFNAAQGDADDWQLGFSPGDFAQLSPQAVFFRPTRCQTPCRSACASPPYRAPGPTATPWRR